MKNKKSFTISNSSKIVTAALGGAIVGAALGIIFAPEKGSVTRAKIAGKAKELGDNLHTKMDEVINQDIQS